MTTGGMMRTNRKYFHFIITYDISYQMGQDAGEDKD
jgi:hypothetical protein